MKLFYSLFNAINSLVVSAGSNLVTFSNTLHPELLV